MSDGPLATVGKSIGELALQLLTTIGLALGGGQAAASSQLTQLQQDSMVADPKKALPPATLAELVVKGAVEPAAAANEAMQSGIEPSRFEAMVRGTGNPPGPGELLTLWRRRLIADDQVQLGMRQGYLKNEWIGHMMQLRHEPLSAAEAVAAAVQNHLPYDAAAEIADMNGVARSEFDVLFKIAGNPPGPTELLNLWVRGYIDEAAVDQGLRESRLKDKWIDPLKRLAIRKVPMRTITTLIGHGAITDERGMTMLRELGYTVEDAQAIIASAKRATTTPHREASVGAIRQLYADRIIDRAEASSDLQRLGYSGADADLLLTLADTEATRKLRAAAVQKVHALFYAHHLSADDARHNLAVLNVPSDQIEYMLQLWSLEEQANVHELTPAQVVAAGKRGLLTESEVIDRLTRFGYRHEDAVIVAELGGAVAAPAGQ